MNLNSLPPKRRSVKLTPKQIAVLEAMNRRNPDGTDLDVWQLLAKVSPNGKRSSMHWTLRNLAGHGLVEAGDLVRREGGARNGNRTFRITDAGRELIRPEELPGG